ncbi:hypothetical protein [Actinomadura roseirufa]|uniref:hypothetical protein n=1 Tax=Actinomadura roseirufa TaxID=2094049 RepID=UPI001040E792|nr:hypothetical protein [Actinomadura roseirufa]
MEQSTPNPALNDLDALIGEWDVAVPMLTTARGRVRVERAEGGAFLRLRSEAPAPVPSSTMMIGRDDASGAYTALYHDSRGVSRLYQMGFAGGVWTMWRAAPGFHQRFSGTLSGDGSEIRASWERSEDGSSWALDFDLTYTRTR